MTAPSFERPLRAAAAVLTAVATLTFVVPASAQASGRAAAGLPANYRISPDDLIGVVVFQEQDLSTEARVAGDGSINLPLIGSITVRGLSTEQAASAIRRALADGYLVDPQVTVNIVSYSKRVFTVLGQVQSPGSFEIQENKPITLLDAIGMAGGFTSIANQKKVILKRRSGSSVQVLELNAKQLAKSGSSQGVEIREGDIITVPQSIF